MGRKPPPKLVLRAVDFRAAKTPMDPDKMPDPEEMDGRTLEGYAAVFDTLTAINSWEGTFSEKIAYGAFRKTLKERTPVLQFDHGRDQRTGSVPIGAFEKVAEDDHGLSVLARLFDNPVVEPIRQAIEGQAITGMSFRFEIVRDEWRDTETGKTIKPGPDLWDALWDNDDPAKIERTIKEVKLFEAGPVVFPAYAETSVGVRDLLANMTAEDRRRVLDAVRDDLAELDQRTNPEKMYDRTDEDQDAEPVSPPEDSSPKPTPEPSRSTSDIPVKEPVPIRPVRKDTGVNPTVEEREARKSEIKFRLQEIDTEYSGAELPDDIRAEWDTLEEEHDSHERAIKDATKRRTRLARLAGEKGKTEDPDDYVAPVGSRKAENIYDLRAIRNMARSFDELGQLYHDHAMRAIEVARFPGVKNRERAQEQVSNLLHSIDDKDGTLARRILATTSPIYERAFGKVMIAMDTNGLTTEERTALAVGTDAAGGYAVPATLDPSVILTSDGTINPLRQVARVVQITGKTWQGITSAGITVSRDSEAEEVSDDAPTFGQPEVNVVRVQGFVPFSIEIDQDWNSMRSEITMMLNDAKETEEATSFITGNGVGNVPGGVPGSLDYATSVVDAGGTFTSADLFAVEEDLPPRWRGRASWLANRSIYNRARALGATSDGGDLWVRLGAGLPPELIGYPAYESSAMTSTVAGTNDRSLVFGDFSQFLIVDRVGMSVELVPHLFGTNRRPTGQRGIYAIWRNNSKVLVPNAFRFLSNLS
jgi:HK97 family phage major capsid protein/HK97 family phage prohead protease